MTPSACCTHAADLMYNVYISMYTVCTKVNGLNVESCCHDDAVTTLKNAGDNVQLTLKYFEPASGFLSLKGMLHLVSETSHAVTITRTRVYSTLKPKLQTVQDEILWTVCKAGLHHLHSDRPAAGPLCSLSGSAMK